MQELKFDDHRQKLENVVRNTLAEIVPEKCSGKYDKDTANEVCEEIALKLAQNLQETEKRFKYSVHAIVLQKDQCALNIGSQHLWNPDTDGQINASYPMLSDGKIRGSDDCPHYQVLVIVDVSA